MIMRTLHKHIQIDPLTERVQAALWRFASIAFRPGSVGYY